MRQHEIAFYSTAAQVLPVLVIVAFFELRLFRPPQERPLSPWRAYLTFLFCYSAMVAEVTCIVVLAAGEATDLGERIVRTVLMAGVVIVFWSPLPSNFKALNRFIAEHKKRQQERKSN